MYSKVALVGAMVGCASAFSPAALPSLARGSGAAPLAKKTLTSAAPSLFPRMRSGLRRDARIQTSEGAGTQAGVLGGGVMCGVLRYVIFVSLGSRRTGAGRMRGSRAAPYC